jgi:hypothetical protein
VSPTASSRDCQNKPFSGDGHAAADPDPHRRYRKAQIARETTTMRYLLGFVTACIRISVGFILLFVGVTCALCFDLPPNASPGIVQARLMGTLMWTLLYGVVGFKMMTRNDFPPSYSIGAALLLGVLVVAF